MIKYLTLPQKALIRELGGIIVPIMTYNQGYRYITTLMERKEQHNGYYYYSH